MSPGGWAGKRGFGIGLTVLPLPLQVRRDTGRDGAQQHRDSRRERVLVRARAHGSARGSARGCTELRVKQRKPSRIRKGD